MKSITALGIILSFFTSCSKVVDIKYFKGEVATSVNTLKDSIFLSDVRNLEHRSNRIYAAEHNLSQVFVFNDDLDLLTIVGQEGEGPGEISYLGNIHIVDNKIYVWNGLKNLIEVFVDNSHYNSIKIPENLQNINLTSGFLVDGNLLCKMIQRFSDLMIEVQICKKLSFEKSSC